MDDRAATHEVTNQVPALIGYDAFGGDAALRDAVAREGGGWAEARLAALGQEATSTHTQNLARLASAYPPVLNTHDRWGNRLDEVEYHPAYHALLGRAVAHDIHALPFKESRSGAHVVRAAAAFLFNHAEIGVLCPVTMTFAAAPCLRRQPEIAQLWEPRIVSSAYDARFIPADRKNGALIGMAMTEKQGGSDVRANTTRAVPISGGGPGGEYLLTGHKWFCSAPMSDAFLTLAQAPGGLSCFFVPRFRPDGERNVFLIQRLKDKLGNRSNASSEIEYRDTWGLMVGEEGRGVRTIMEMVQHTRLDVVVSAAAIMRIATAHALHHAAHRRAFGEVLVNQPAMRRVLTDLVLESEASTALVMHIARRFDESGDDMARALARIGVAAAKFWVAKRVPTLVAEALEVHGGNGYVETGPMARLYREAPLNGIWEGTGNVMALDVLRAIAREPRTLEAMLVELRLARGGNRHLDGHLDRLEKTLRQPEESEARRVAAWVSMALSASLLVRHAPDFVADAYCAARLGAADGLAFGMLPHGLDETAILRRAMPTSA